MITLQGAGAIVTRDDGTVLLTHIERRGMRRWELPTAIRKSGESLFMTVLRCAEEDSGFRVRVRISRPVCLALNSSKQLDHSFFGMFFECSAEETSSLKVGGLEAFAALPTDARQTTLEWRFLDWRSLPTIEMHPQHRAILERWSSGTGSGLFAIESDADQEVADYQDGSATTDFTLISARPPRAPSPGAVELRWVHVSDIHFGDRGKGSNAQKRLILSKLVEDVATQFRERAADYVFVTGDIAYSAQASQYADSLAWLRELARAAGVGLERIWLVPGNHDVDRGVVTSDPSLQELHREARGNPVLLDDQLADVDKRARLGRKLDSYVNWVKQSFGHLQSPLDWRVRHRTRGSRTVLIAGLCTVWVSDQADGSPSSPGTWLNNMHLSKDRSLDALETTSAQADVTLLLTHHPESWLSGPSRNWLAQVLGARPAVHLCGHVHEESAGVSFSMGENRRRATIVAGAVDDGGGLGHGYSWGELRFAESSGWHLGWAPRVWARGRFTADRTNYDQLDPEGYAWERIA